MTRYVLQAGDEKHITQSTQDTESNIFQTVFIKVKQNSVQTIKFD